MNKLSPITVAAMVACASTALLLPSNGVAATYTWTVGAFVPGTTAPEPLPMGDVLVISGTNSHQFNGVSFTNGGTVDWLSSNTNLPLNGGASIVNNGLWDSQGNAGMAGGASSSFTNNGTLRKSGGTLLTSMVPGTFTNSGTLEAQTGILRIGGFNNTFNAGTSFAGAGVVEVTSASTFNGAFNSSNLRLLAGTQTGNSAVLSGTVEVTNAALAGSWEVAAGQSMQFTTNAGKGIGASTSPASQFVNNGTMDLQAGVLGVNYGSTLTNNGQIDIAAGQINTVTGGGNVVNNGVIRKSGDTGLSGLVTSTFANNGTIDVQTGTLRLNNGFVNAGALTGDGAFQIGGTGLNNQGTVGAGSGGIGQLDLAGTFAQAASGTLAVDVFSLTSFDLVNIAGGATLGGTLALNCLGACSFNVGDTFTILDGNGLMNGTFADLTFNGFGGATPFDVIYDVGGANVKLLANMDFTMPPVPEPSTWALMLGGVGMLGFMGRRRRPA